MHFFECQGEHFLVNVESQDFYEIHPAVFHLLGHDADVADAIRDGLYEEYGEVIVALAMDEVSRLTERNAPLPLLFTGEDIVACYTAAPITTVNLLVSYKCNLACSYCYSKELRNRAEGTLLMRLEVAFRAVDLFLESSLRHGFPKVTFKFSGGGEPLMNFDLIRQLIEYVQRHELSAQVDVQFKLSTNGILLSKEIIDFFKDKPIEVKISIDGCEDIHGRQRSNHKERGTYKKLIENIKCALETLSPDRVVAAVTILDPEQLSDTLVYLIDMGFQRIRTQKAIVPQSSTLRRREWRVSAPKNVFLQYYEILKKYKREGVNADSWPSLESIDMFIEGLNRQENKRYMACNAGIYDCAVDPDGNIYSCNRFAGDPSQKMGDVFRGIEAEWREDFCRATNLCNRSKCLDCWLIYWCGGNCNYLNQIETGDMLNPRAESCDTMKDFFEHVIWFYCKLRRENPGMLEHLVSRKVF